METINDLISYLDNGYFWVAVLAGGLLTLVNSILKYRKNKLLKEALTNQPVVVIYFSDRNKKGYLTKELKVVPLEVEKDQDIYWSEREMSSLTNDIVNSALSNDEEYMNNFIEEEEKIVVLDVICVKTKESKLMSLIKLNQNYYVGGFHLGETNE